MFKALNHLAVLIVILLMKSLKAESQEMRHEGDEYVHPEQVHISLGDAEGQMWVTWVTFKPVNGCFVEYGLGKLDNSASGNSTKFTDGGSERREIYIHRVQLLNLLPNTTYSYHCGNMNGWSPLFSFRTLPSGHDWAPSVAVFGDMGSANAQSLPYLTRDVHNNLYDMIFHVGDFAYNMNDDNARVGDQFMRQIESIAAHLPYMTVPGNHESYYNFSNYRNRFTMPNSVDNFYYSFDLGPAHIVAFSSEAYFYESIFEIERQYRWLESDLKKANNNRKNVPWLIVMAHRPLYCSNWDDDDCSKFESVLRQGITVNGKKEFSIEDLFFNHGVDIYFGAHEHTYERMLPLYDRNIFLGRHGTYDNPCAPVHIVGGSAGCKEHTDPFKPHPPPWSAYRSSDYGYGRLNIHNKTHLSFEQVSIDLYGQVIDRFWLKQDHHGPFDITRCGAIFTKTTNERPPIVNIPNFFAKKRVSNV